MRCIIHIYIPREERLREERKEFEEKKKKKKFFALKKLCVPP